MIKRLQQAYSKFIFCLGISGSLKTFFLLIVNSKLFHRFQKKHTATDLKNQATPVEYAIVYNQKKSKIFLRTYAGDIRMFYEIFLEQMYWLPDAVSFSDGVIIDAGANIGMAALYFSYRFPAATIFCIEPAATNIGVLEMNLARSINSGKARIIKAALYEKDEDIYINNNGWAYNASIDKAGGELVSAITMKTFLEKNKLEKIDLLKVDIEGAENFIFLSHQEWLPKINAILIEIHSHQMIADIQAILVHAGFFCYNWHKNFNNVFFASRTAVENPVII